MLCNSSCNSQLCLIPLVLARYCCYSNSSFTGTCTDDALALNRLQTVNRVKFSVRKCLSVFMAGFVQSEPQRKGKNKEGKVKMKGINR